MKRETLKRIVAIVLVIVMLPVSEWVDTGIFNKNNSKTYADEVVNEAEQPENVKTFENIITNFDHWVAFILLVGIGINMVKEAFDKESENVYDNVDVKTMLVLSIATSIDALAIGITFACLKIHIVMSVITIGLITFIISVIGVKIGNRFGHKYEKKAEIMGGVILILLGIKILLEHLGIINF